MVCPAQPYPTHLCTRVHIGCGRSCAARDALRVAARGAVVGFELRRGTYSNRQAQYLTTGVDLQGSDTVTLDGVDADAEAATYGLFAIVFRKGQSDLTGHWRAAVRIGAEWWGADDDEVGRLTEGWRENPQLRREASLLFYRRAPE